MEYAKCINLVGVENNELVLEHRYWLDFKSLRKNDNDEEILEVYTSEKNCVLIGTFPKDNFEVIYRYLIYGGSVSYYINYDMSFLLKDIIRWCCENTNHQLSEKLLAYIVDNIPNYKEMEEKEYFVCSKPFVEFAKENKEQEYLKYLGYSLRPLVLE